jgi:hypothetical protein
MFLLHLGYVLPDYYFAALHLYVTNMVTEFVEALLVGTTIQISTIYKHIYQV